MNLENAVDLYGVERDGLARVLERHQSYPHEKIGFQEYREIPDSEILRDDEEHFIIRITPEHWDYEMRHLMDEDMDIDRDPELTVPSRGYISKKRIGSWDRRRIRRS